EAGPNPDVEIGDFLTSRGFTRVPALMGAMSYARIDDDPASVVMLQQFVRNQGNAWEVTIEELGRYFDRVTGMPPIKASRDDAHEWAMGRRDGPSEDVQEAILTYLATADVLG